MRPTLRSKPEWEIAKMAPWNRRLLDLCGAMAWTRWELCKALGVHIQTLWRIMKGDRPPARFLVKLQENERLYEDQIAEYVRAGRKRGRTRTKRKYRDRLAALSVGLQRITTDLSEMGGVATAGAGLGYAVGGDTEAPLKLVYLPPSTRRKRREDSNLGPG